LTDTIPDADTPAGPDESLRSRIDRLEQEQLESRRLTEQRIVFAELKVEALRAGIVDLDGLKFLDVTKLRLDEDGGVADGPELIGRLKRSKPWLFSPSSSSSIASVPVSRQARLKLANEMTDDEYRIARAQIIKRSMF